MRVWERRLLLVFSLTAIVAGVGLYETKLAARYHAVATTGGIYQEGVLVSSSRDTEALVTGLTKIGLVQLESDGTIGAGLATEWHMSDDNQTLHVTLDNRFPAQDILGILQAQTEAGYWNDGTISAPDEHSLEFKLAKPWAGFVSELTPPIFLNGPFKENQPKDSKSDTLTFDRNSQALVKPFLDRVVLHLFTDDKALERALRKGTLDGAYVGDLPQISIPKDWQNWQLKLHREQDVIFNEKNDQLAQLEIRKKIINHEHFDQPLELRLAVSDSSLMMRMASDLRNSWSELNIKVKIESYPLLTLTKSVLPDRNFDVLLMGIDYGPDDDLFPYWHSSQIVTPGFNLAGYRNKDVDKLLDQTRQTTNATDRHKLRDQVREILKKDATYYSVDMPALNYYRSPKFKGDVSTNVSVAVNRWANIASWYTKERQVRN